MAIQEFSWDHPVNVLVIGDSHAKPDEDNDRYDWAAKLILDRRPDVVVDMGDFADMPSLSSYDRGKASFEGRRLQADIDSACGARERLTLPLHTLQGKQRANKEKVYRPTLVAIGGNHEHRINRLMNSQPELDGAFSEDVSGAEELGWLWIPFKKTVRVQDVLFRHYFSKPGVDRAFSGKYPAANQLAHLGCSSVAGHSHRLDYYVDSVAGRDSRFALIAGCFFDHHEDWAGEDNAAYWRGLVMINGLYQGFGDIETISMERIKNEYGT